MSVTIPCDAKLDKSKRVDRPTGSANWLKNLARGGDIPYPPGWSSGGPRCPRRFHTDLKGKVTTS